MKQFVLKFVLFSVLGLLSCAQKNGSAQHQKNGKDQLNLTDEQWKQKLTPEQYYILREKGTEKPFSGAFVFTKDKGVYKCAGCGESLFTDEMKFESHCGWPSFDAEISGGKIKQTIDNSYGMERIEITCAKCGGHLGHIFNDGPTKTGKRYCVNSGSLSFEAAAAKPTIKDSIVLASGCFWCTEAVFESLKGVISVESGYSGGRTPNPSYAQVCSGATGHAEAVKLIFDPQKITLEELLEVFFSLHDPTTLNKQGADEGTQYRSAIFYTNDVQKNTANRIISELNQNKVFKNPIVTEVTAFSHFYTAENYHQEYYALNKEQPYCQMVIKPKMDKLHAVFAKKLKSKL